MRNFFTPIIVIILLSCIQVSPIFSQTSNTLKQRNQEEKEQILIIDVKKLTKKIFTFNNIQYNVIDDINFYKLTLRHKWDIFQITDKDGNFIFWFYTLSGANEQNLNIISESTYKLLLSQRDRQSSIETAIKESAKKGHLKNVLTELSTITNQLNLTQIDKLNCDFSHIDYQLFKELHKELGYKKFSTLIQNLKKYLNDTNKQKLHTLIKTILEDNNKNQKNIEDQYRTRPKK